MDDMIHHTLLFWRVYLETVPVFQNIWRYMVRSSD